MPPSADTSGRSRTPLSDYVLKYMERTQVSANQLAQRCIDPENPSRPIYPQWLKALWEARLDSAPALWRLRALSVGLGAEVTLLKRLAAAQWLELEYEVEEAEIEGAAGTEVIMIPVKAGLPEARRRRILQMAALLAEDDTEDAS